MVDKGARQSALRRLVRERALRNQSEIVQLMGQLGFQVTQASVSRDARDLGLLKVAGRYVLPDDIPASHPGASGGALNGLITQVDPVGANLVVLRTPIGVASQVAIEIDKQAGDDVVGTIAGDDTVFIAVRSRAGQGRIVSKFKPRRERPGALAGSLAPAEERGLFR